MNKSSSNNSFFITLYTDASFSLQRKSGVVAWRGKCAKGSVQGNQQIACTDIHEAEMAAIRFGISKALEAFPELEGFFVNSDNINCVKAFWTFDKKNGVPGPAKEEHQKIMLILNGRWIRAKHVKAHTGNSDVRSYMNRAVDRLTRGQHVRQN